MSNIRDLGHKINSLKNMQKVMRAMNMISSIKLRKLYPVQDPLSLFDRSIEGMRAEVYRTLSSSGSLFINGFETIQRIHIVMFTSDKGLCGTHNSSVQKAVDQLAAESTADGVQVEITCIGNKGAHFCKRREYEIFQQAEINERAFTKEQLRKIALTLFSRYREGSIQKLFAVGNIFHTTLHQETLTMQLLPFLPGGEEKAAQAAARETDPSGDEFAAPAAELYTFYKLRSFLLNSYLSEHSSRMTAMENATNNSEDLINKYITMQNHARQASITNELIEIVSGKEALKG